LFGWKIFLTKKDNFFWNLAFMKKSPMTKTTGDESSSIAGKILATFTEFQLLLMDSKYGCWNLATMARFRSVSPESGLVRPRLQEFGTNSQIPAKLTGIWHSISELPNSGRNFQILALAGF
jgi:hypothetical protein